MTRSTRITSGWSCGWRRVRGSGRCGLARRRGEVQFKGVRAASRNYNVSTNLPKIDGILGFNLFSEYLLTLDFPAKRVRLERGELPKADGADEFSLEIVPEARIKFVRGAGGKVSAVNVLNRAGEWERAAKEP